MTVIKLNSVTFLYFTQMKAGQKINLKNQHLNEEPSQLIFPDNVQHK